MHLAVPLPAQLRSGRQGWGLGVQGSHGLGMTALTGRLAGQGIRQPIQQASRGRIEVAVVVSLHSVSEDPEQEMLRQVLWRWSAKSRPPPRAQSIDVEAAQLRDLILDVGVGLGLGNADTRHD
jgi:hypothetical protein